MLNDSESIYRQWWKRRKIKPSRCFYGALYNSFWGKNVKYRKKGEHQKSQATRFLKMSRVPG